MYSGYDETRRNVTAMANLGNDWNSFMQTKQARMTLYGISVFFCLYYAVDALMELMSPERSATMMQMVGPTGYYAMTIARFVVLLVTGIAFGRMVYKTYASEDE